MGGTRKMDGGDVENIGRNAWKRNNSWETHGWWEDNVNMNQARKTREWIRFISLRAGTDGRLYWTQS
jgi:hypothetical protein